MKNKLLLIFLIAFTLIILPMVLAETNTPEADDVFKVNSTVNYAKPCFNNGTYCSGSALCNYTVFYPNNSILVANTRATNNIYNHNISFGVNFPGIHKVDMICNDGGLLGSQSFYFLANNAGSVLSTGESVIYIILFVGLFFTFVFSLIITINIPGKNQRDLVGNIVTVNYMKYVKVFMICMTYLILLGLFGITNSIINNLLFLSNYALFFSWIFWLLMIATLPLIVLSLFFAFANWITDKKLVRMLERGIPTKGIAYR